MSIQEKLLEFEKYLGKFTVRLILHPDMSGKIEYCYYGDSKIRKIAEFCGLEEFFLIDIVSVLNEGKFRVSDKL